MFEFYPAPSKFGEGSNFGRALNLANFLSSRGVSAAKTVAFIPKTIKGHAVLVAMACEEIVMAPDAEIGDAGVDLHQEEVIDPTVRSGYFQIAQRRKTIPAQVALGMLDRDLEVLQVETEVSTEFVLRSELDELKRRHTIQSEKVIIPAGQLGLFTGRTVRELGFVKYLAADRPALAKALGLPVTALEEDPTLGGESRTIRVPVKGAINANTSQRVQKMIQSHVDDGDTNFVCLWIDSPGGSLLDSISMANYLAGLDPSRTAHGGLYLERSLRRRGAGCDGLRPGGDAAGCHAGRIGGRSLFAPGVGRCSENGSRQPGPQESANLVVDRGPAGSESASLPLHASQDRTGGILFRGGGR